MLTKKPSANKITEPLAFTACKLKLRGKAVALQSRFRRTLFGPLVNNNGQNGKRCATKQKETGE